MKIIETETLLIEENRVFVTNKITGECYAPLKHDSYDTDTDEAKIEYVKNVMGIE